MKAQLGRESVSVVLLGNLNPAIFTPLWFAEYDLVRLSEAKAAEVQVIHPDVSSFGIGGFQIQVTREKFVATTSNSALYAPLRDLVVGTFGVLEHTPLTHAGINRDAHIESPVGSVNRLLAAWARAEPLTGLLNEPRAQSLSFVSRRTSEPAGMTTARVEPSVRVTGLFFSVNEQIDHSAQAGHGCGALVKALSDLWLDAQQRADGVREQLLSELNTYVD